MDNVFDFRNQLISEYSSFSRSFSKVSAQDILSQVEGEYDRGRYWPEPLIQINPNYKRQSTVQQLTQQGVLHAHCADIFRTGKTEGQAADLHLYVHQLQALAKAQTHPDGHDGGRLHLLQAPLSPLSATAIRQAYAAGQGAQVAADLPPGVAAYIAEHGLYTL